MDTLDIIQDIIHLGAERDRLALECASTGEALRCEIEAREELSTRIATLRELCDELRSALNGARSNEDALTRELSDLKLRFGDERAECERLREVARQAIEQRNAVKPPAFMPPNAILKAAQAALNADIKVLAVVRLPANEGLPDQTIVTKIERICDPSEGLPIMFELPVHGGHWQYIYAQNGTEGILTMELL